MQNKIRFSGNKGCLVGMVIKKEAKNGKGVPELEGGLAIFYDFFEKIFHFTDVIRFCESFTKTIV
jgi:hypothetical protein